MEEEGDEVKTWAGHRLIKDVLKEKRLERGQRNELELMMEPH